MLTQSYTLSLQPGALPTRVPCTQADNQGRTLTFQLTSLGANFTPPTGAVITMEGTKPDGHSFSTVCTMSGSLVSVKLTQQMTAAAGEVPCQLTITSSGKTVGTARFFLCVEPSALPQNPDLSDTELSAFTQLKDQAVQAAATATQKAAETVSISDTKANKAVPSDSFNFALLTADGNLADSGFGGGVVEWTPVVAGASSYSAQNGCIMAMGSLVIVQFYVSGEMAGSATQKFAISGCPANPSSWSAGGGHLSGYTAASNTVFSGWIISPSGVINPRGQQVGTVEGDGNKWEDQSIFQKSSGGFSAMGTIAFRMV